MNIAKWKDLAELVALVAVIGSLVAVAIELRQTQEALRAQAYQSRALDGIATNLALAQNEELARLSELIESPDIDPAELSLEERRKVSHLLTVIRIDLDNEHYQYQKGLLDPGFYHGESVEWIRAAAPVWRAFDHSEPRPDFRQEVDRILAE
jgi:hypothetical protein